MMKTFVMIPTYNEADNIARLIKAILDLKIKGLEIVVVDDNSPDRTWEIVQQISNKNGNVHLLLRTKDKGRGLAGVAGFKFCLERGADYIIEMDADFSHDPKYIPEMLKEIKHYDLVLGSRMVSGGSDKDRSAIRQFVTKGANLYIRLMLGLKVKDCNSGLRCFRREILEKVNINTLEARGPNIVQELLFKCYLKGARIKEIPIEFIDRKVGSSKLGIKNLIKGYTMVLKLKGEKMIGKLK